jgi:GTP cyclohydrolase FolE2
MNVIEQHVELTDDVLTVPIPAEWKGKGATLKLVLDEEKKPKGTRMSRFRGILKDMSAEEKADMERQLTELRNEWERPIY